MKLYALLAVGASILLCGDVNARTAKNIKYVNYSQASVLMFTKNKYIQYQITIPQINNFTKIYTRNLYNNNTTCLMIGEKGYGAIYLANAERFENNGRYECGEKIFNVKNCVDFGKKYCYYSTIFVQDLKNNSLEYSYVFSRCRGIILYRPYYNGSDEYILEGRYGVFHNDRNC